MFVDRDGTADLTFGQAAACQLTQVLSTKEADLLTRNPANAFFSLNAGRTHCVFSDRLAEVAPSDLCGIGEVLATGVTIGRVTCQHDPVFEVAVYRGSFVVRDPSGTETALAEGLELRFDFEEGTAVVDTAVFTPEEVAVFERLAASIDMEIPPPETETPTTDTSPVVPENIEAPTISRQDPQGPLAADPGEWSGDPEFAYQWEGTCSFEGTDCRTIEGATEPIYSPLQEDCPYVRVVVEARTDDGLVSAVSAPFNLGCVE